MGLLCGGPEERKKIMRKYSAYNYQYNDGSETGVFFTQNAGSNMGDRYYPETPAELKELMAKRPISNSNAAIGDMHGPDFHTDRTSERYQLWHAKAVLHGRLRNAVVTPKPTDAGVIFEIDLGQLPVEGEDYGHGPYTDLRLRAGMVKKSSWPVPGRDKKDEEVKALRRRVEDRLRKGSTADILAVAAILDVE
jgi:hypothetical protein